MADDVFQIVGSLQAGSFKVEEAVAEGGYAVVYRAFHSGFRGPCALKCLKIPDEMTTAQRGRFLEKFRGEAELLFRLSAAIPEIVRPLQIQLLEVPNGRFVPFLALEWLEGEPLDRIIDRRAAAKNLFSLKEIVELLTPIARALARAHSFPGPNGSVAVVHCDMKPENIFVAQAGGEQQLKLVDFGIATAQSAATQAALHTDNGTLSSKPNATQMAFSPQYAAPEQWLPEKFGPTGPWTDVYGLALTLVEALIGRPPLEGEVSNMRALATDPEVRPTPKRFGLRLGQKVDRVFDRALAVDPRLRIRDVAELWTDLERAMGLEPSIRSARQAGPATASERDRFSQSDIVVAAEERVQFDIEDVPPSRPGVLPQSLRPPPSVGPASVHPSLTPLAPLAVPLSVAPGSLSRSGRYSRTDLQALAAEIHAPPPPPPKPLVPAWLVLASLALAGCGVALYMMGYKVWILPPALIVVLIGIYLARERD